MADNKEKIIKKTKKCRACKEEIDYLAKVCPLCREKQGTFSQRHPILLIFLVVLWLFLFGGIYLALSEYDPDGTIVNDANNSYITNESEKVREYIKVDVDNLEDDLSDNAAYAKDKYNGRYLEISGKLGTIDSDLKYISLISTTKEFDFLGVLCRLTKKSAKDKVKTLSRDQYIIVRGKITDVGEVLGYYLDVDEIITQ